MSQRHLKLSMSQTEFIISAVPSFCFRPCALCFLISWEDFLSVQNVSWKPQGHLRLFSAGSPHFSHPCWVCLLNISRMCVSPSLPSGGPRPRTVQVGAGAPGLPLRLRLVHIPSSALHRACLSKRRSAGLVLLKATW